MQKPLIQFYNVFKKFGFTAVMISHEVPGIFFLSQRIAMLSEGKIRFEGTPGEIQRSTDSVVRLFIRGLEKPPDALTGMATPEQGRRKFQEELTRLQRHRIAFSVVMSTIGNLAEINTRMGHVIGQTMLKNVAAQIKQHLDITDFCSRYSLDRILVVLQNAIGVIMGSNIGTTITVLLGAIGGVQAKQRVG
jgi:phospholipid/cholesterol/gamma-HCH transport system ATP-binding protein